jgi:nitrogen regulatory protein PII
MNSMISGYSLLVVITGCGTGSRVLGIAKKHGVNGGTVALGKGTARNRLLNFLELCDIRKEIVIMASGTKTAKRALTGLNAELRFEKKGHGIAFTIPLDTIIGISHLDKEVIDQEDGDKMYKAIFTIVERGLAETVMDAATAAGARGGTIINARGSGIHETSKLFAMEIEPEKEIVLIITEADQVGNVTDAIRDKLHIDEPGRGIIFTTDVSEALGLY